MADAISSLLAESKFRRERTCARCGDRFVTLGKEYTCKICRKTQESKTRSVRLRSSKYSLVTGKLSRRQNQIVALICKEALSNKEIAYRLLLSEGTVKEYLYWIYKALHVSSRGELMLYVVQRVVGPEASLRITAELDKMLIS